MKATLEFDLSEEKESFDLAVKASNMHSALWEIRQRVFRPARKHGYDDERMQKILSDMTYEQALKAHELIAVLEEIFNEILEEQDLNEFDI